MLSQEMMLITRLHSEGWISLLLQIMAAMPGMSFTLKILGSLAPGSSLLFIEDGLVMCSNMMFMASLNMNLNFSSFSFSSLMSAAEKRQRPLPPFFSMILISIACR